MTQKKKKRQRSQTKIAIPPIARTGEISSKQIRQVKMNMMNTLQYLVSSEFVPSRQKESFVTAQCFYLSQSFQWENLPRK